MGQLQRILATIRVYLGKMSVSQQLLLGSLAVIALMALLLLAQYAGRPQMVELMPSDDGAQMLTALEGAGIEVENRNGTLFVPPSARRLALAQLGQQGMLPNDTTILFGNLLEKQSWRHSQKQNSQLYLIALQNELGRTISLWDGIKSATVLLDIPDPKGIGMVVRRPTASATVFSNSGRALTQNEVDAIAGFIAGARAGLEPAAVRIVDGSTGQQRRPTEEGSAVATTYLEHAALVERDLHRKLNDLLAYIPGVMVAVTAQVDVTQVSEQRRENLGTGQGSVSLPSRESRTEEIMQNTQAAGEPGVRSNAGADINRGGGAGQSSQSTTEETEFENAVGTSVKQVVDPRGHPTRLAASINVPRGYVRALVESSRAPPAEGEAPTPVSEAEIESMFTSERARIEAAVRPHVAARGPDGEPISGDVVVSMIPVDLPASPPQQAGVLGGLGGLLGGSGDGELWASGGLVDTIAVGVLAAVALGMMLLMVRKAGQKVTLPTARELVGIPPALEGDSELIGEADETDAAMTGIEVGDDRMQADKVREQVVELVNQDADQAAKLISRWIRDDE